MNWGRLELLVQRQMRVLLVLKANKVNGEFLVLRVIGEIKVNRVLRESKVSKVLRVRRVIQA